VGSYPAGGKRDDAACSACNRLITVEVPSCLFSCRCFHLFPVLLAKLRFCTSVRLPPPPPYTDTHTSTHTHTSLPPLPPPTNTAPCCRPLPAHPPGLLAALRIAHPLGRRLAAGRDRRRRRRAAARDCGRCGRRRPARPGGAPEPLVRAGWLGGFHTRRPMPSHPTPPLCAFTLPCLHAPPASKTSIDWVSEAPWGACLALSWATLAALASSSKGVRFAPPSRRAALPIALRTALFRMPFTLAAAEAHQHSSSSPTDPPPPPSPYQSDPPLPPYQPLRPTGWPARWRRAACSSSAPSGGGRAAPCCASATC
jgi:hypothetical protein